MSLELQLKIIVLWGIFVILRGLYFVSIKDFVGFEKFVGHSTAFAVVLCLLALITK